MKSALRTAAALLLVSLSATSAFAQTIGTNTSPNRFPFGSTSGNRYQQVYAASSFSGLTAINQISFFHNSQLEYNQLTSGTFTFSLSTTSVAVDALSTTFNANLGANNTLFGTYVMPGGTMSGNVLAFLGNTFNYDPSAGNLLLDIQVAGASGGEIYLDAMNGDAAGVFSRMHNYGSSYEGWGLVTNFALVDGPVSTVPEPGTYALMGAGLAAIAFVRRRRRA